MGKITVSGIQFDNVNIEEAVKRALRDHGEAQTVVTPNALIAEACAKDPSLCRLVNSASLVLPDGAGILSAARRQGTPLRQRVAGIDFAERLLAVAAERGVRGREPSPGAGRFSRAKI